MVAPQPSSFGQMTPAERKAAAEAHRMAEAQRKAELARIKEQERAARRVTVMSRQATMEADLVQQCKDESRFPVRLGNLFGPEGNVFNVIGAVRAGIRWAEARGVHLPDEAYAIVNGYMQRKYEETLGMIEDHAIDLDASLARYWMRENDAANSIGFGDNPLGGFFGQ